MTSSLVYLGYMEHLFSNCESVQRGVAKITCHHIVAESKKDWFDVACDFSFLHHSKGTNI